MVATVFPRQTRTLPLCGLNTAEQLLDLNRKSGFIRRIILSFYVNQRYQELKRKESQALLSEEGSRIFAQRKVDVEPVFGQIKACLGDKRCQLRGKRQVKIDMGLVLMANNLLKYNKRMIRH